MTEMLPIKRSKTKARRFYDRISGIYDILTASEKDLIKQGVDLLSVQPGERVLEIGCGTGSGLKFIQETDPNPVEVIGLDLSRQMLHQSLEKNHRAEPPPLHIQGDAVNLPLPGAAIDAVFTSFTLELFSKVDIAAVLGECRRVLKPKGRLVVVSLASTPRTFALKIYELAHRLFPVAVDCRPIPLAELLEANGFLIITEEKHKNWGLPIHFTLSTQCDRK